ncbi:MAG: hypothetical protein OEU32_08170 [Acidimicrobiia bacterium]|nr:hypothetical protein [Acidimicrobiia bacterium]
MSIDDRLSAYLDHELDAVERVAVEAELADSPMLRAELVAVAESRHLLRTLPAVEPTPGLFDRPPVTAVAAPAASLDSARARRRRRLVAPAVAVVGIAALWLLILGVFSGSGVSSIVPAVDQYVDRHAAAGELDASDGFVSVDTDDMPDMPAMLDPDTNLAMTGMYERDDVVHARYSDGEHELSVYREPGVVDWDALSGGEIGTIDGETVWHLDVDNASVLIVERAEQVITVVADPGMDDMMMTAANGAA